MSLQRSRFCLFALASLGAACSLIIDPEVNDRGNSVPQAGRVGAGGWLSQGGDWATAGEPSAEGGNLTGGGANASGSAGREPSGGAGSGGRANAEGGAHAGGDDSHSAGSGGAAGEGARGGAAGELTQGGATNNGGVGQGGAGAGGASLAGVGGEPSGAGAGGADSGVCGNAGACFELACARAVDEYVCEVATSVCDSAKSLPLDREKLLRIPGDAQLHYDVTLRIQASVELRNYPGATRELDWPSGLVQAPAPSQDSLYLNVYSLRLGEQEYFINSLFSGYGETDVVDLDYVLHARVQGDADVSIRVVSSDCEQRGLDQFVKVTIQSQTQTSEAR